MPEFQSYSKNNNNNNNKRTGGKRTPPDFPRSQPKPKSKAKAKTTQSKRQPQTQPEITVTTRKLRKNPILYILLVAIVAVSVIGALSVTVLFNANEVLVRGESIYTDEEILAIGGIETGQNLIRFDNVQAEQDIMRELVCLDSVRVKKVFGFPSSIVVEAEGSQKQFSVSHERDFLEVSQKGRIINIVSRRPTGLVVIGFAAVEPYVGGYLDCGEAEQTELVFRLVELIERHEVSDITRIDITDRFDIKLYHGSDRVEVKLGAAIQLEEKLMVAARIIEDEIDENESGVLRVSNPRKASFKPNT